MSIVVDFVRRHTSRDKVVLTADCPTVWVTRDSISRGKMLDYCDLWIARPMRVVHPECGSAHWINPSDVALDQCYLGSYTLAAVKAYIRTVPDTDLQCIMVPGSNPSARALGA